MIPSPDSHLIKTAYTVFRYDDVVTEWGWPHDVYFDPESNDYVVMNFPINGHTFAISRNAFEFGPAELTVNEKTFRVKIYEK